MCTGDVWPRNAIAFSTESGALTFGGEAESKESSRTFRAFFKGLLASWMLPLVDGRRWGFRASRLIFRWLQRRSSVASCFRSLRRSRSSVSVRRYGLLDLL